MASQFLFDSCFVAAKVLFNFVVFLIYWEFCCCIFWQKRIKNILPHAKGRKGGWGGIHDHPCLFVIHTIIIQLHKSLQRTLKKNCSAQVESIGGAWSFGWLFVSYLSIRMSDGAQKFKCNNLQRYNGRGTEQSGSVYGGTESAQSASDKIGQWISCLLFAQRQ